jgi:signal transduction histidine kinase
MSRRSGRIVPQPMHFRTWFRPPRRFAALFIGVALVPSVLLLAVGWRLLQQDLQLERQRLGIQRDQAADLVVSTMDVALVSLEDALRRHQSLEALAATPDSVVLTFTSGSMAAAPAERLLYWPVDQRLPDAPPSAMARGEELEHRDGSPAAAAGWFAREAARSSGPVRARALAGLARNLRKLRRPDSALATYAQLMAVEHAGIAGVPADLFARWAYCELLAQLGRREPLRTQARELKRLLLEARWRITRPVFLLHFEQASNWAEEHSAPPAPQVRLADAAGRLWQQWREEGEASTGRRQVINLDAQGAGFMALSQPGDRGAFVLIAGQQFVERHVLARVRFMEARDGLRVELRDPAARTPATDATRRYEADTKLPWTIIVQSGATASMISGRRTLWMAGLVMLSLLLTTGAYAIGRAVSRELAVARLQSDFVAAVSHEFRTPLTTLRQLSEMLADRPNASEERRVAYYGALRRQTERLHRLVESLLDFGRMEAGSSLYRFTPVNASSFVRDVVGQFSAESAAVHRIDVDVAGDAVISGDREALANVLWNLLDNAIKYSPTAEAVRVEVTVEGAHLAIRVRDDGFGIPHGEQRDIFGKFVRGAFARAQGIRGTGIGLAMVHHIVESHGGRITVDSVPGQGSTFTMLLPIVDPGTAGDRPAVLAPPGVDGDWKPHARNGKLHPGR